MKDRMPLFVDTENHRTIISFDDPDLEVFFPYDISDMEVAKYLYNISSNYNHENEIAKKKLHLFMNGKYTRKDFMGNPNLYLVEVLQWIYKKAQGDASSPKITTIKFCRTLTGCGLREAKDFCENEVF